MGLGLDMNASQNAPESPRSHGGIPFYSNPLSAQTTKSTNLPDLLST